MVIMNNTNRWVIILAMAAASITVNAGIAKKQWNPDDKCGSPRETYVTWSDLRLYLNKHHSLSLPGGFQGPPLKVMRCVNTLTPCNGVDSYCGVRKDQPRTKTLPIKSDGGSHYLVVEYVEASECECMNRDKYESLTDLIGSVPYVFNAYYVP